MNYRLPKLEDYEILKDYVIEHYSNHERSISASLGMTNMKYEDWVEKVNLNSEKADDEWGRYYLYLVFDEDKLVFKTGKFNNMVDKGFQEGYYPTSKEIEELFDNCNFEKIDIKSIRGIGYEKENNIYNITDEQVFNKIMELIEQTSNKKEIIEMCGHAMYIGKKK